MPRTITVTFADGSSHVYQNAPDNITPDMVEARAFKEFGKQVSALDGGRASVAKPVAEAPAAIAEESAMDTVKQGVKDLTGGLVRGAGSIGATILAPYDMAKDALAGKGLSLESNRERRNQIDQGLTDLVGSNPDNLLYQGGKLAGEIAGTAGAGGVVANGARALKASPILVNAIRSGGFTTGAAPGTSAGANMAARVAGGAINGGVTAAMVDPESAGTGAAIGGALPGVTKGAGIVGNAIGKALGIGKAAPEVAALAKRAKDLGIDIPADRVVDSKPMNALASALNYVPFSGRAATEATMEGQLNRAASRLIGQDTPNMTKAIRDASIDLGGKFDTVLKGNTVKVDNQFLTELAGLEHTASRELGSDGMKAIKGQIDEILAKGGTGEIDGQAAYNIKRTLDRIGRRNTPEAFHAIEMKKSLMGALDRSIGPEEAAAFAKVREQYGNMIALEKIAKNGAEGDISVARLANMKNINNRPLQELADIAAQFVKSRESQHGAMQRAVVGMASGAAGGFPGLAAVAAGGRTINGVLNSNTARRMATGEANPLKALASSGALRLGYRAVPVATADR